MKKLSYVLCSVFIMMGCILGGSSIHANGFEAKITFINPLVKAYFFENGVNTRTSEIGYIHVNEQVAYCVEPYKVINDGTILVESSLLSDEQKEKISIISYNGYNQSDRKSDKWYIATQVMIWESLGISAKLEGFDDYEDYRKQIQERINAYDKLPSFNGEKLTLKKGEKLTLQDTNQIFSSFKELSNSGSSILERSENNLSILSNCNKYEEGTITYKKFKQEELGLPIIYRSPSDDRIQSVIYPSISKNVEGSLSYRVQSYGNVQFSKTGNMLMSSTAIESEDGLVYRLNYGEGKLEHVKANVYAKEDIHDVWGNLVYAKGTLVDALVSGDKESSKELLAGKYYLKEIATLDGYVLDDSEHEFTISNEKEDLDIVSMVLKNERARVNMNFKKIFEEGSLLDVSKAYEDVIVGIYTKNDIKTLNGTLVAKADSLVYRSGIDASGNLLELVDLPLGEYYLKELHTNEHFVLDENVYEFSVKANGTSTINVSINNGKIMNYLHRNQLKIYKTDKENTPLQAKFVLYDETMNEICEFSTDKNGIYEFEDLVDGTYFIQEIEAPEGYKLNNKIHKIVLHEDFTYTIKNTKNVVNPSIETNDTGNHRTFEFSMLGSMITMYALVFRKLGRI